MPLPGYGIMFHHFHRLGGRAGQGSITGEELAEMIDFVGRDAILPAQEWYERAQKGTLRENDTCLTFDDNLKCQYDIARPVLEDFGLTAFFFIYSSVCMGLLGEVEIHRVFRTEHFDSVEEFYAAFEQALPVNVLAMLKNFRPEEYLKSFSFYTPQDRRFRYIRDEILRPEGYMRVMDEMIRQRGLKKEDLAQGLWMQDKELRALAEKGHMVGLHSFSHPTRMCELSTPVQLEEYRKNYEHITVATGKKPVAMSHPCNSYDASTLEGLSRLGINVGFCSNMEDVPERGKLEYPRMDHANILKQMDARERRA